MLLAYFYYAESAFFLLVCVLSAHEYIQAAKSINLFTIGYTCAAVHNNVIKGPYKVCAGTDSHTIEYTQEHTAITCTATYGIGLVYGKVQ